MGDRPPGSSMPVSVRIPMPNIRPTARSSVASPSVQIPRSPMANPVYLLPKSGVTPNHGLIQVRSVNPTQNASLANGVAYSAVPQMGTRPSTPVNPSSAASKLFNFLSQLLELSKDGQADTHTAVVRLIQALVNAELDATTFCAQLRAKLKSANTSTDIGPFISDNIDALRRDLATGIHRLPNINPPILKDGLVISAVSSVTSGPTIVQSRSVVTTGVPFTPIVTGTQFSVSNSLQPRVVTSLLSVPATPVTASVPSSSLNRMPQHHPPLLAPAPLRASFAVGVPANQMSQSPAGSIPKYRLTQSFSAPSSVPPILPASTIIATRLSTTISTPKPVYPTLRPAMASSINPSAGLPAIRPAVHPSPLIRTKFGLAAATPVLPRPTPQSSSSLMSAAGDVVVCADELRSGLLSPSKDQPYFPPSQIRATLAAHNPSIHLTDEAIVCLSHGLQSFTRTLLSQLSMAVAHRMERLGDDSRLSQTSDVREQLRFLQKLDEHDRLRRSELEKDLILKAAKSRSRTEDPDQVRMREMARRIASEDYEREKQHQANLTALHAIGPQKRRRFDLNEDGTSSLLIDQPSGSRLSLLKASQLGTSQGSLVLSHTNPNATLMSQPFSSTVICNNPAEVVPTSSAAASDTSYSLAHTSRVHRATSKDLQLVLSRSPRLRRTRTFFQTYWRSADPTGK